ncbi:MAG: phosphoribosylglycinamide formyltransferase [Lachnospiraceae bacterium]|nr:phosphoribosylglycinamide formyltransferase [Lachnospiraceae bacterium]
MPVNQVCHLSEVLPTTMRVLVLVSGGGTNLQAIIDGILNGTIRNSKITGVISNNRQAYALERAKKYDIPAVCISPKDFDDREEFHRSLYEQIVLMNPDLIVTSGFLVKVPENILTKYAGKIINIHPSLIPSFCGVGYYGLTVHEKALERGVKITGATVHFVDGGMDTGPIFLQKAVDVLPDDTPETLQKRVMEEAEWIILPKAIDLLANRMQKADNI